MKLVEVTNTNTRKEFLHLPLSIYKDDPNWIRPLNKDIEDVFDLSANKLFRNGEAIRWILIDDNEKTVGRVAAFINQKTANTFDQPTGGMGFFECVNDQIFPGLHEAYNYLPSLPQCNSLIHQSSCLSNP